MKFKISLRDWAQISEITASLAVVISLVFVVISIDRNTVEFRAQNINDLYDSIREIEMTVLADADLTEIVRQVENGEFEELDQKQKFRYMVFMTQHLSIWEQMWSRVEDGSVSEAEYLEWKIYFIGYFSHYLPAEVWALRKDWFTDPDFQLEVESNLESLKSHALDRANSGPGEVSISADPPFGD